MDFLWSSDDDFVTENSRLTTVPSFPVVGVPTNSSYFVLQPVGKFFLQTH